MKRVLALAATAAVAVAIGALVLVALTGTTQHPSAARDRTLGLTDASKRIAVSLILRVPGQAALTRYLESTSTRGANSEHALRPEDFGRRFGLSTARIGELTQQLTKRRLGNQRGAKLAQIEVARRLTHAIWHILTNNEPFNAAAPGGAAFRLAG